jgi:hypothetical protein
VYLALKTNFLSMGQYDDARWAFVKERRMARRAYRLREDLGHFKKAWGFVSDWWLDTFTGYLTEPLWVLLRLVIPTFFFFAFLYWVPGLPRPQWRPDGPVSNWLLAHLWNGPAIEDSQSFVDCLIFSGRSLVTLAFSDIEPANLWAKIISPLEGAVGVTLFALFVVSLGRRVYGY